MDVNELVNSQIFYPKIWVNYNFFADVKTPVIVPYNKELSELEYEDPSSLFDVTVDSKFAQKLDQSKVDLESKQLLERRKTMMNMKKELDEFEDEDDDEKIEDLEQNIEMKEQYEMQFNYIYLETI